MTGTQRCSSYAKSQLIRRVTGANECAALLRGFHTAVSTCWAFSPFAWFCLLLFEYKNIMMSIIRCVTLHLCTQKRSHSFLHSSLTTPNHSSSSQVFCYSFSWQPPRTTLLSHFNSDSSFPPVVLALYIYIKYVLFFSFQMTKELNCWRTNENNCICVSADLFLIEGHFVSLLADGLQWEGVGITHAKPCECVYVCVGWGINSLSWLW